MTAHMGDVGEKNFISELLSRLTPTEVFVNGFGHDASVVDFGQSDGKIVFKIDRAAQPIAVNRGWADYRIWGRLAVTTTCSDILVTGGIPTAFMVAAIVPREFLVEDLMEVIEGVCEECQKGDVAFVGGDTKEGPHPELVGSGIGKLVSPDPYGRFGANEGDLLVVAGDVGGYLGAYHLLDRGIESPEAPGWVEYVANPTAQWEAGIAMAKLGAAVAAMDCSDGLYEAAKTISNGFGCRIYERALPYHRHAVVAEDAVGIPRLSSALGVGDWNILYAVSPSDVDRVLAAVPNVVVVGEIGCSAGGRVLAVDSNGYERSIKPIVNEHFVTRQEDEGEYVNGLVSDPYAE